MAALLPGWIALPGVAAVSHPVFDRECRFRMSWTGGRPVAGLDVCRGGSVGVRPVGVPVQFKPDAPIRIRADVSAIGVVDGLIDSLDRRMCRREGAGNSGEDEGQSKSNSGKHGIFLLNAGHRSKIFLEDLMTEPFSHIGADTSNSMTEPFGHKHVM
jgi:hypothetical protein